MGFSEFELFRCGKKLDDFLERRRPRPEMRDTYDMGWRVEKQSVLLFEIRAHWDDPGVKLELPVAKATYVRSRGLWKVYWMRASGKWEAYPPMATVPRVEDFLALVEEDAHGCFWG